MGVTLYKETDRLDDAVFKNPPSEYRGTPFWAWNGDLKEEYLLEQIGFFKEMGFGGAHMHVRTGLAQKYLGEEHMRLIKSCTDTFKKKKMLSWLYDEDRWPSGAAGGYVTKTVEYRQKCLSLTTKRLEEDGFTKLLAYYDVMLDDYGFLSSYRRIGADEAAQGMKWYAYQLTQSKPDNWFNGQTKADLLNRDAVKAFIEITYDAYAKTVGNEFGKTVPAIFTDEPNFGLSGRHSSFSKDGEARMVPWTTRLPAFYRKTYGEDILDFIPELFWELPDGRLSAHRYRLYDVLSEMFTEAFSDQCGKWCEKHGILLTGHVVWETPLSMQSVMVGDAMRSYRGFGLPGIDNLCDAHEFGTAKQCQSAVRQYGRCGMLSELYGVTNWDYDFRGHKHQGDWQAALGVTTRVPHLAWYSMEGEAKRDYPAAIGYQSPWYAQYRYVEDHFARVNTAMTRGRADVKVGVIHPIETTWLYTSSNEKTADMNRQLDERFDNVTKWLLFGTIDFDYICEATLPKLCAGGANPLKVGKMRYDAIVVPGCETLRSSTLERLEAFRDAGGTLIFIGDAPSLCDALPSQRAKALYDRSEHVTFGRIELLEALTRAGVRDISIIGTDGAPADNYIYQLRTERNGTKWLFLANGVKNLDFDIPKPCGIRLSIRGRFVPVLYETLNGTISEIPYTYENGETVIERVMYEHDSLLLRLDKAPAKSACAVAEKDGAKAAAAHTQTQLLSESCVDYTLSEENVYVIDAAKYCLNDGPVQETEEILRIDTACRKQLGWPGMNGDMVQPWVTPEAPIENYVTLYCPIESEIDVPAPVLAIEKASEVKIVLNGESVNASPCGYFADRYIEKVPLPPLHAGKNELILTCPIGRRTSVEYAYLLGNFGVRVIGREKVITPMPEKLHYDDIRIQGLPFYGGNITYRSVLSVPKRGTLSIHLPSYRGAVVSVRVDGKEAGYIAYAPYTLSVPDVKKGEHTVEITLYGNRFNCFGELHFHHYPSFIYYGPSTFRSTGDEWSYEYETKPTGILRTPVVTLTTDN